MDYKEWAQCSIPTFGISLSCPCKEFQLFDLGFSSSGIYLHISRWYDFRRFPWLYFSTLSYFLFLIRLFYFNFQELWLIYFYIFLFLFHDWLSSFVFLEKLQFYYNNVYLVRKVYWIVSFSSGFIFAYFVFIFPFGAFLRFKRDALDSPLDLWVHDETEASFHINSNY